jgi:hypothetical protein
MSGKRGFFGSAVLAAVFGISAASAGAAPHVAPLTPMAIIGKILAQNAGMQSYESDVHVVCRLLGFPYLGARLDGKTYFKRPDNFEVAFDRVPSFAHGFEHLYSDIGDPSSWPSTYYVEYVGETSFAGHRELVLRLVKKNRGMIDHEDVAIDPVAWHIDNMQWFYYNGGYISMSQDYRQEGSFSVLGAQHATIRIPHVHAMAEAVYENYHTNVAIDDSVFTKDAGR